MKDIEEINKEDAEICKSDDTYVSLWDGVQWYEIDFERCHTEKEIIKWIYHLTDKTWVTGRHINLFISHVIVKFPELSLYKTD